MKSIGASLPIILIKKLAMMLTTFQICEKKFMNGFGGEIPLCLPATIYKYKSESMYHKKILTRNPQRHMPPSMQQWNI